MSRPRRTQLLLLATGTTIVAIASTVWWLRAAEDAGRTGHAIVLLLTAVGCLRVQRVVTASPAVLATTLIGLGVTLISPHLGPMFPAALASVVGIAWAGVAIGRYVTRSVTDDM